MTREFLVERTFSVTKDSNNLRLDKFLTKELGFLSRTKISLLINDAKVRVDNKVCKASFRIQEGQTISLIIPETSTELKPYNFPLKIIYEDNDIIVIDKPINLVVHPPQINYYKTLVNALVFAKKKLANINTLRPGVVHRLDKETSGVMVLAKTNSAYDGLVQQFQKRLVKKEYLAIVWGNITKKHFWIKLPLTRDPKNRLKMKVGFSRAKEAQTEVIVVNQLKGSCLLSIFPLTGRMHQIRVHLNFLGFPIVGDKKYGIKDEYEQLFLHAKSLSFRHPVNDNFLSFDSSLPQRFSEFIEKYKI
jgi:23S rRNA pseudouridine1911/1915/1917 synthase